MYYILRIKKTVSKQSLSYDPLKDGFKKYSN